MHFIYFSGQRSPDPVQLGSKTRPQIRFIWANWLISPVQVQTVRLLIRVMNLLLRFRPAINKSRTTKTIDETPKCKSGNRASLVARLAEPPLRQLREAVRSAARAVAQEAPAPPPIPQLQPLSLVHLFKSTVPSLVSCSNSSPKIKKIYNFYNIRNCNIKSCF